ncbi:hypothetical protein J8273_3817 [Carpediemonas membranifera]|uniref:Abnormal spindle-like microcephaly-associated protein ASH domain-containing protein n=1 Tax=Carpediemonas membranifera TaxID=201153 RepID=A0A8J6E4J9_9EUKA|nr:hypothetical protein J8273_3817 [Carpediemonas membranifera]|eukprot:KAG9394567.1 hypothetical protein J8273_3817 [Carpediemonas membranifera]
MTDIPRLLSRRDRANLHGIDCPSVVHWEGWKPNVEYSRSLVLKNTSTTAQDVLFTLPSSEHFAMNFPDQTRIPPGMAQTFVVVFRPDDSAPEFETKIVFELPLKGERFAIELHGLPPKRDFTLPESFDFETCPVQETVSNTQQIANIGQVPITFKWEFSAPFHVMPASGTIKPGDSVRVVFSFSPTDASTYISEARCCIDSEEYYPVTMRASSRFPFVTTGDVRELDYGPVLVGQFATRTLTIFNRAPVSCTVNVQSSFSDEDSAAVAACPFSINKRSFRIAANGSTEIKVKFKPNSPGMYSEGVFTFVTPSGARCEVRVSGSGLGALLTASTNVVQFGQVVLGETRSIKVQIKNHTSIDQPFKLTLTSAQDPVIRVTPSQGWIKASIITNVTVTFSPTEPRHYLRRLLVLGQFQDQIDYIDVMGTSFIPDPNDIKYGHLVKDVRLKPSRPAPFTHGHVQNWAAVRREAAFNDLCPPVDTQDAVQTANATASMAGTTAIERRECSFAPELRQATDYAEIAPHTEVRVEVAKHELLATLVSGGKPGHEVGGPIISFSKDSIDFGSSTDPVDIEVENTVSVRVAVQWTAPRGPFTITPQKAVIGPNGMASFKVSFRPQHQNDFTGVMLTCSAQPAMMSNYLNSRGLQVIPPVTVSLPVAGHSFNDPTTQNFIPKIRMPLEIITLPSVCLGAFSGTTFPIYNTGDVNMSYSITLANQLRDKGRGLAGPSPFVFSPPFGVIPPNSFTIVGLAFLTTTPGCYADEFTVTLNAMASNSATITCLCDAQLPDVDIVTAPSGNVRAAERMSTVAKVGANALAPVVVFPPTALGATSTRHIEIRSRIHVNQILRFTMPESMSRRVRLPPSLAVKATQRTPMEITWEPHSLGPIEETVQLHAGPAEDFMPIPPLFRPPMVESTRTIPLKLVGVGTDRSISLNVPSTDLGIVLNCTTRRVTLTISNCCDCPISFTIAHRIIELEAQGDPIPNIPRSPRRPGVTPAARPLLTFSVPNGSIPPRSEREVEMAFRPTTRGRYTLEVIANVASGDLQVKDPSLIFTAISTTPSLTVDDLQSNVLPRPEAWHRLGLDSLNEFFRHDVGHAEVAFRATRGLLTADDGSSVIDTLATFPVVFPPQPVDPTGQSTSTFVLTLTNNGPLRAKATIRTPNEFDADIEPWAIPFNQSSELQHILEEEIFKLTPKDIVLEPSSSIQLVLTYAHKETGPHTLPLVLDIDSGRICQLKLIGNTEPVSQPIAQVPSKWMMAPVVLGDDCPPVQYLPIVNLSDVAMTYRVDTRAAEERCTELGFPVFSFPGHGLEGLLQARATAHVAVVGRPLQTGVESANLPIQFTPLNEETEASERDVSEHQQRTSSAFEASYSVLPSLTIARHQQEKAKKKERSFTTPCSLFLPGVLSGSVPVSSKFPTPRSLTLEPPAGSLAMASIAHVSFGSISTMSLATELFTLQSHSDYAVDYAFSVDPTFESIISITPHYGQLEPRGSVNVRLAASAPVSPLVLDTAVTCSMTSSRPKLEPLKTTRRRSSKATIARAGSAVTVRPDGETDLLTQTLFIAVHFHSHLHARVGDYGDGLPCMTVRPAIEEMPADMEGVERVLHSVALDLMASQEFEDAIDRVIEDAPPARIRNVVHGMPITGHRNRLVELLADVKSEAAARPLDSEMALIANRAVDSTRNPPVIAHETRDAMVFGDIVQEALSEMVTTAVSQVTF